MKTKKLVKAGMLLALGTVLHAVVPPLFLGVKPDLLLAAMFLALMMMDDIKEALPIMLSAGILAAMTTGFPGGELPNTLDKLVSGMVVFYLYHGILKERKTIATFAVVGLVGTLISGTVFLSSALLMVGIPFTLSHGMMAIVLPTAVANAFVVAFLQKIFLFAEKHAY